MFTLHQTGEACKDRAEGGDASRDEGESTIVKDRQKTQEAPCTTLRAPPCSEHPSPGDPLRLSMQRVMGEGTPPTAGYPVRGISPLQRLPCA